MIDHDLALLYGVSTKRLNEQVKRNKKRFPEDFMFRLTKMEKDELVANCDQFKTLKHSRVSPTAFTEQGVAMLSSVLNSEKAVEVNMIIMRTFVRLREILNTNKELAQRLDQLEKRMGQKDHEVKLIFEAIRQLMQHPKTPKRKIGFHTD